MKRTPLKRKTPMKRTAPKSKGPERKKCKCGNTYTQYTTLQNKCVSCLAKVGKDRMTPGTKEHKESVTQHKREHKEKDKTYWREQAQKAVNRYIRMRDRNESCPTCERPLNRGVQLQAGHFKTRGSHPAIRYVIQNIHGQCASCNLFTNDLAKYEAFIVRKYGQEMLDWLNVEHGVYNFTVEDMQAIALHYKNLCGRIENPKYKYRLKLAGYAKIESKVETWLPERGSL